MSTPSGRLHIASRNNSLERSNFRSESFSEERDVDGIPESGCLSIVVLGASGDLAKKKTFPALFHLFRQGFLQSNEVHIFGYARTKISSEELRERLRGPETIILEESINCYRDGIINCYSAGTALEEITDCYSLEP